MATLCHMLPKKNGGIGKIGLIFKLGILNKVIHSIFSVVISNALHVCIWNEFAALGDQWHEHIIHWNQNYKTNLSVTHHNE